MEKCCNANVCVNKTAKADQHEENSAQHFLYQTLHNTLDSVYPIHLPSYIKYIATYRMKLPSCRQILPIIIRTTYITES